MFSKKMIIILFNALSLCCLTSWSPANVSRLQRVPDNYDDQLIKLKDSKKKQKEAFREHQKSSYLAHQKNRLAYFADHDGFIWFKDQENKHTFFLGNFYPSTLKIWEMKFTCAEAAFQAAKFLHKPEIAVRFTHLDAEKSFQLAQKLSYQQRGNWYQTREDVMLQVVRAKFEQHPELSELLLATGNAYLVLHTSRDAFWADGGEGTGKNRLGILLMQLRQEKGGIGPVSKPSKYKKFLD